MAFCDWRSFGWTGAISEVKLTETTLTITTDRTVHRYRKVRAVPFGGPSRVAPDPNATAPFPIGAVVGKWYIVSLDARGFVPGATGTIEFLSDGSFLGETPCETVHGTWSQAALSMATTISLTLPHSEALRRRAETGRACARRPLGHQGSRHRQRRRSADVVESGDRRHQPRHPARHRVSRRSLQLLPAERAGGPCNDAGREDPGR